MQGLQLAKNIEEQAGITDQLTSNCGSKTPFLASFAPLPEPPPVFPDPLPPPAVPLMLALRLWLCTWVMRCTLRVVSFTMFCHKKREASGAQEIVSIRRSDMKIHWMKRHSSRPSRCSACSRGISNDHAHRKNKDGVCNGTGTQYMFVKAP